MNLNIPFRSSVANNNWVSRLNFVDEIEQPYAIRIQNQDRVEDNQTEIL